MILGSAAWCEPTHMRLGISKLNWSSGVTGADRGLMRILGKSRQMR